jgi:hypothetical protein
MDRSEAKCDQDSGTEPYNDNFNITYRLDDRDGFFTELQKTIGIDQSWIDFPEYKDEKIPASTGGKFDIGYLPAMKHIWRYKPTLKSEFPVPNPKEIFQQARPNIIRLQSATAAARLEMMMSMYSDGDTTDAARVHSVPTFLASQAIEQMETVRQVGKEVEGKRANRLDLDGSVGGVCRSSIHRRAGRHGRGLGYSG